MVQQEGGFLISALTEILLDGDEEVEVEESFSGKVHSSRGGGHFSLIILPCDAELTKGLGDNFLPSYCTGCQRLPHVSPCCIPHYAPCCKLFRSRLIRMLSNSNLKISTQMLTFAEYGIFLNAFIRVSWTRGCFCFWSNSTWLLCRRFVKFPKILHVFGEKSCFLNRGDIQRAVEASVQTCENLTFFREKCILLF